MKICPKCNKEHNKPGTFCSRECANSRIWTDSQKKQRSIQLSATFAKISKESLIERSNKGAAARAATINERLMSSDIAKLGHGARRKRVLLEQNNKCNRCGLDSWLGEPISLELEHKDGNNKNNVRENIECLCPNCHALTPTWRGRNR